MSVLDFHVPTRPPITEDSPKTSGSKMEPQDAAPPFAFGSSISGQAGNVPQSPEVNQLGSLRDHRLRVVEPFVIAFRSEDSQMVAEAPEIDEFGFGQSPAEALEDLQHAIVELYLSLDRDQSRLGIDLERVWAVLCRKIQLVSGHEGLGV